VQKKYHRHVATALALPPAGGGRRGEVSEGAKTGGTPSARCPLPTSPRWGEGAETVLSPTFMAFLIDDNVFFPFAVQKVQKLNFRGGLRFESTVF
jgi:hypothetical protein